MAARGSKEEHEERGGRREVDFINGERSKMKLEDDLLCFRRKKFNLRLWPFLF